MKRVVLKRWADRNGRLAAKKICRKYRTWFWL